MFRETYSFDDILLVPRYSSLESRSMCDIKMENYDLPVIMSPMDTVTTFNMIEYFLSNNLMATLHRYFKTPEAQFNFIQKLDYSKVFFAIGSIKKHKDWIDYLYNHGVQNYCIDMAHGDSKLCVDTIHYLRSLKNMSTFGGGNTRYICVNKIMAGNVVTKSGFSRLQDAGADYIRVGIGSGSICSTRINTGTGLSQGTAIEDCASRKTTSKLIADGGIKSNGDVVKALALGADYAMLGKMLASTDLAGGEYYDKNKELTIQNPVYKSYHGMASRVAREGVLTYSSVEGVAGLIPYTGKTQNLFIDMKLNLKASMSYCGVRSWREFQQKAKIVFISNSGIIEGNTHIL